MESNLPRLKDLKPVISGYLSEALVMMKRDPVPDDVSVHDIRVLMKKTRAALKLLSHRLDQVTFRKEYLVFRDTGRALGSFRETLVHRKTLKSLKKQHRDLFLRLSGDEKIGELMRKYDRTSEISEDVKVLLGNTVKMLNKAAFRIRFLSLGAVETRPMILELEKSYSVVCRDYLECRNNPKPAGLHRLRKRSKDLLYQLYFFRPVNPGIVRALEKKLDIMAQNLGGYNDLTQLLNVLGYTAADTGKSPVMDELMIIIRSRQDVYLSKVWPVAYKIFCPGRKLADLLGFKPVEIEVQSSG